MTWRNCQASMTLIAEINARWPGRDKASDGTIGDAAHAARTSDHNPWFLLGGVGIVRARDVDKDGVDAAGLVEYLRQLGARKDPRLFPGGYLIFNRRITNADFSGWHAYTGTNPHDHHFHVSFSTVPAGFDSTAPWGIATAGPSAPTAAAPTGDDVELTDRLPDLYTQKPDDSMSVADTLAWAAAHAANARDAARAAATSAAQSAASATRIEAAVAQLLQRPAVQLDPAAVQAAVVTALGGGLTITGTAVPASSAKG